MIATTKWGKEAVDKDDDRQQTSGKEKKIKQKNNICLKNH